MMATTPVPRPPGSISLRSGGLPANKTPGIIEYVPAEVLGFEKLPVFLRHSLRQLLVGKEIAADAESPVTRRQPDGTYYQFASAWWASNECLVVIEGRQPLMRVGGRRFTPSGEWSASGTVNCFPPGLVATPSRWRLDGGAAAEGTKPPSTKDVLDALPPALAAPLMGGISGAWLRYRPGWAVETIVALRQVNDRAKVLMAEREGKSRRSLSSSEWRATTLDSPIVTVRGFSTGLRGWVELTDANTSWRSVSG